MSKRLTSDGFYKIFFLDTQAFQSQVPTSCHVTHFLWQVLHQVTEIDKMLKKKSYELNILILRSDSVKMSAICISTYFGI